MAALHSLLSLCAMLTMSIGLPAIGIAQEAQEDLIWRRPDYDAINCLFLQLRCLGYTATYQDYLAAVNKNIVQRRPSLASLTLEADRLGYKLLPVQLTMSELESLQTPALVHLESTDEASGHFACVVRCSAKDVILIDGAKATRETLSRDSFRRQWTGYVLAPAETTSRLRSGAALVGGVWIIMWLLQSGVRAVQVWGRADGATRRMIRGVFGLSLAMTISHQLHGVELPPSLREAVQANADQLSPISISWSEQLTTNKTPAEVLRDVDETDVAPAIFFFKSAHRFAWKGSNAYVSRDLLRLTADKLSRVTYEYSRDGDVLYEGSFTDGRRSLFKRFMADGVSRSPAAGHFSTEYLRVAGFRLPRRLAEWNEPRAQALILHCIESGATIESVNTVDENGTRLVRVALMAENEAWRNANDMDLEKARNELADSKDSPARKAQLINRIVQARALPRECIKVFFFDPTRQYAVVRVTESYRPDTIIRRTVCSSFQAIKGRQVQMPKTCIVEHFTYASVPGKVFKEPIVKQVFSVSEIEDSVAQGQFALNYTQAGTSIRDATLPEAQDNGGKPIAYVVPGRAGDLDAAVEEARARIRNPDEWIDARSSTFRRTLLIGNIAVVVAIVSYFIWRRASRRAERI
jgi:hypothetical protein